MTEIDPLWVAQNIDQVCYLVSAVQVPLTKAIWVLDELVIQVVICLFWVLVVDADLEVV